MFAYSNLRNLAISKFLNTYYSIYTITPNGQIGSETAKYQHKLFTFVDNSKFVRRIHINKTQKLLIHVFITKNKV